MEPLHNPNEHASRPSTYAPRRSRWPGLLGAAAIVAAVIGVTMWAQNDDARKADAPLDKGASVTAPAQPGAAARNGDASGTGNGATNAGTTNSVPSEESKVATQPAPARQ